MYLSAIYHPLCTLFIIPYVRYLSPLCPLFITPRDMDRDRDRAGRVRYIIYFPPPRGPLEPRVGRVFRDSGSTLRSLPRRRPLQTRWRQGFGPSRRSDFRILGRSTHRRPARSPQTAPRQPPRGHTATTALPAPTAALQSLPGSPPGSIGNNTRRASLSVCPNSASAGALFFSVVSGCFSPLPPDPDC